MGAGRLYCSPLFNKVSIRLYEKIIARVEIKRKQTPRVGEYEYLNCKTKGKKVNNDNNDSYNDNKTEEKGASGIIKELMLK